MLKYTTAVTSLGRVEAPDQPTELEELRTFCMPPTSWVELIDRAQEP